MRTGLMVVAAILVILGLSWGAMEWRGVMANRAEQIRYDIHKESQTHRDGLQRNLDDLKNQWERADAAGKAGIAATVKHQYSQTDTSEYPAYLQDFLRNVAGIY